MFDNSDIVDVDLTIPYNYNVNLILNQWKWVIKNITKICNKI